MKKTNKGFTLVELIIVIAVIGVLAAILIPVFSNVVTKANQKSALSDARNAVTEFTAQITTGDGASMPESVIFAEKGNKVFAFTYTHNEGVKAVDEEGKAVAADFAATVKEYEDELVASNTIKARSEDDRKAMFMAAKTAGINTGLRTYMALDNDDAALFAERSLIKDLGFDDMVITLSYVPATTMTQNAAAVQDTTYSNCYSVNGVAQPSSKTLQQVIDEAPAGATIRLYKDYSAKATANANPIITIDKDITIDGNGHTIKNTRSVSGANGRIINIAASDVTVTIKNAILDNNNKCARALQINSNCTGVTLNVENVTATATYYCLNICAGCDGNTVNVTDSNIKGWSAIQSWSAGTINVKNSVLHGLNNKSGSSWNTFATICVEGDSTMATTQGADNVHIAIEDSLVIAEQTTGNMQFAFGFNPNSVASSITVMNSDILNNFVAVNPEETNSGLVYSFGDTTNEFTVENCSYNAEAEIDTLTTSLSQYEAVQIPA